jgi:hypothetical protein
LKDCSQTLGTCGGDIAGGWSGSLHQRSGLFETDPLRETLPSSLYGGQPHSLLGRVGWETVLGRIAQPSEPPFPQVVEYCVQLKEEVGYRGHPHYLLPSTVGADWTTAAPEIGGLRN